VKQTQKDGFWAVITHARGGSFFLLLIVVVLGLVGEILFWIYGMVKK
jgi:hypothetical protein